MSEFDALLIASEHSGKSIDEMLSVAEKNGFHNRIENKLCFNDLLQKGYIEGAFVLGLPVTITRAGKERLNHLAQEAKKATQEERNNASNKKLAIAGILVPFVLLALEFVIIRFETPIFEFFDFLWNWIKDIIQKAI